MARLQRPHLGGNAEQLPKEILDMGRQIDQQIRFARMPEPVRIASRRHQPLVQRGIALGQMRDKSPVEAREPVPVVQIGERKPVFENEIRHTA